MNIIQPAPQEETDVSIQYFEGAGLFTANAGQVKLFGTTTKGGVYKAYKKDRLIWSDTGYAGKLSDGTVFCQNKPLSSSGIVKDNVIEIEGSFQNYSSKRINRIQMIGLRLLSLLFGWIKSYSNGIRFIMQKILIYDRKILPFSYRRKFELHKKGIKVKDDLYLEKNMCIDSLYRSSDCVNTHVITSDSFQIANLLEWEHLTASSSDSTLHFEKDF
ncbi:MAG: hypothetical protein HOC71_01870 [Candidatus Latescibacteria bacterium]|nr:hypothetical protein [Candidatus Latescibacterota bacterium]